MRILMVCLGNICRSPTAEAALRETLDQTGLGRRVDVDSAGTGSWHTGSPPDERMTAVARDLGLELGGCARQVTQTDFVEYDLLLAMDRSNLEDLMRLAPNDEARERIRLFREFDPEANGSLEVPDPYYGGHQGFVDTVTIARRTAHALVEHVRATLL